MDRFVIRGAIPPPRDRSNIFLPSDCWFYIMDLFCDHWSLLVMESTCSLFRQIVKDTDRLTQRIDAGLTIWFDRRIMQGWLGSPSIASINLKGPSMKNAVSLQNHVSASTERGKLPERVASMTPRRKVSVAVATLDGNCQVWMTRYKIQRTQRKFRDHVMRYVRDGLGLARCKHLPRLNRLTLVHRV